MQPAALSQPLCMDTNAPCASVQVVRDEIRIVLTVSNVHRWLAFDPSASPNGVLYASETHSLDTISKQVALPAPPCSPARPRSGPPFLSTAKIPSGVQTFSALSRIAHVFGGRRRRWPPTRPRRPSSYKVRTTSEWALSGTSCLEEGPRLQGASGSGLGAASCVASRSAARGLLLVERRVAWRRSCLIFCQQLGVQRCAHVRFCAALGEFESDPTRGLSGTRARPRNYNLSKLGTGLLAMSFTLGRTERITMMLLAE